MNFEPYLIYITIVIILPSLGFYFIFRKLNKKTKLPHEQTSRNWITAQPKIAPHTAHQLPTLLKPYTFGSLTTRSFRVQEILKSAEIIALSSSTVLLIGESGTGKEEMAKAIHEFSNRSQNPFIAVHAASFSENLLESELFGHEKGSFTGAQAKRVGRFEMADKGTLFLDEVGELSPLLQVKLLRVLQERRFERVGGNETISVDVRIIAATNKDLLKLVRENKFREDLYYRLNVISLNLVPLRNRKEDIPLLTDEFIKRHAVKLEKENLSHNKEFIEKLTGYSFPGNIRELSNIIERAVVFATKGEEMGSLLIQFGDPGNPNPVNPVKNLEVFEKKIDLDKIRAVYQQTQGNKSQAARMMNMAESTYRYHLKKALEKTKGKI